MAGSPRGLHHLDWTGYDEAMILYVLALGSPTHPDRPDGVDGVDPHISMGAAISARSTSTSGRSSATSTPTCGSISGGSRTHTCAGRGSTTSRTRAARRSRSSAYAIENPGGWKGYGAERLGPHGLRTARSTSTLKIDGRNRTFHTYWARGASPRELTRRRHARAHRGRGLAAIRTGDRVPAIREMRDRYGEHLYASLWLSRRLQSYL